MFHRLIRKAYKPIDMEGKNSQMQVDPVYSKKVIEMLTVANEYCLFLENVNDKTKEDVLDYLQKIDHPDWQHPVNQPVLYRWHGFLPE